jgi:hypothetical protein
MLVLRRAGEEFPSIRDEPFLQRHAGGQAMKEEFLAAFVEGFKGAIRLWVSIVTAPVVAVASVIGKFVSHSNRY